MKVLIIDDDSGSREMLAGAIRDFRHTVIQTENPVKGIEIFQKEIFDVVFTDLKMPQMTGIEALQKIKKIDPEIPVIIVTAYSSIETAITGIKAGAYDYLVKPIDINFLESILKKVYDYVRLYKEVKDLRKKIEILNINDLKLEVIGNSEEFQNVLSQCNRISQKEVNILILGETGTGKENIARLIHSMSGRSGKFIAVNCGAIPENLIESELFGYKKGAFTGAYSDTDGKFKAADNGTLFLDEIGELPLNAQVKLLRVLQEKHVTPLGDTKIHEVNCRIIAATNRNLSDEIKKGNFREDLFWRVAVVTFTLPPLRERRNDIEPLIKHFITKSKVEITNEAMTLLRRYNWPGNIRELENALLRAAALCYDNLITLDDLPHYIKKNDEDLKINTLASRNNISLPEWLNYIEREEIKKALTASEYVQVKAAENLGISERMLRYNMKKYNIHE